MSHTFISTAVTTTVSLCRDTKNGETIGIIVENKRRNGLEINLECVILYHSTTGFRCLTFVAALGQY